MRDVAGGDPTPDDLPARLRAGVDALRQGRPDRAAALLASVTADPAFQAADDLRDVRARALSLQAQALFDAGRPAEADRPCRDAIRLLRALRDKAGLSEVRALQDRIVGALAHDAEAAQREAERQRIAATPLEDLLADARSPSEAADRCLKKASALLDGGELAAAAPVAADALARAEDTGDVRLRVLARIAYARSHPSGALDALVAAHGLAADAAEFNLVSVVARAADVLDVALPLEAGPHAGRRPEDA